MVRKVKPIWEALGKLDRRWVYLFVSLSILFPLLFPLNLPLTVTKHVKAVYDRIENLPDTSAVLIAFDFDPSSIPECLPMAISLCHHVMKSGKVLIVYTNFPETGPIAERVLEPLAAKFQREYGKHYVNLGFKPGNDVLLMALGSSWTTSFPKDFRGNSTQEMEIFSRFPSYRHLSFMVDVAHGATVDFYITIGLAQFGVPLAAGVTAVSIPQYEAFVQTGQLVGLLGGLKGAAEYEKLVGTKGKATRGMDAQSVAHLVIIFFIFLGNVSVVRNIILKNISAMRIKK
ncbi:MAG: hypothetical protein N2450_00295 [bacterium]|nr:hypothetical protein [bacterium]